MKTIYLLRHAKSGWPNANIEDFDRPLEERGRINAAQIGQYFSQNHITPDIILCSTAARTLETLTFLRPHLPENQTISLQKNLYLASPDTILDYISHLETTLRSVLVIAHNPGIHELAIMFSNQKNNEPAMPLIRLMQKFPSGALATFQCEGESWSFSDRNESNLIDLVYPADLPQLKDNFITNNN